MHDCIYKATLDVFILVATLMLIFLIIRSSLIEVGKNFPCLKTKFG